MITPQTILVFSLIFTDAAFVVFSVFAYKFMSRRDAAITDFVTALKDRQQFDEDQFKKVLSDITYAHTSSLSQLAAAQEHVNKSVVTTAKETHRAIVETTKETHRAIVETLGNIEQGHANSTASLIEAHQSNVEAHKLNAATHEKIQEAANKASEVVAQAARVSVAANHGKAVWDRESRQVIRLDGKV